MKVVDAGAGERPRQHPPEARRQDLRRREAGGDPGADATAAGDELADRLAQVAGLERLLVALVRLPLDEGLAPEARHLVALGYGRARARRRPRRRGRGGNYP
jgi:hypothetical protein